MHSIALTLCSIKRSYICISDERARYANYENTMNNDVISLVIGRRVCRQSFARKRTMLRLAVFLAVLLLVSIPQGEGKRRSKLSSGMRRYGLSV